MPVSGMTINDQAVQELERDLQRARAVVAAVPTPAVGRPDDDSRDPADAVGPSANCCA